MILKKTQKMPVLCQEYMLFFCLPLSIQPRLDTQQQQGALGGGPPHQGRAPLLLLLYVEPWLNTHWQTDKLHILLAEDGHIFSMPDARAT